MQFIRLEAQIEVCGKHLERSGARNSEIEAYLTRYLLAVAYAEIEAKVIDLISMRADLANDRPLSGFARSAAERLLRSLTVSELKGLLGRFGQECKQQFADRIENTPAHAAFDRIVQNRHITAHSTGSMLTFGEFTDAYGECVSVLDAFADALGCPTEGR